jgi:hypothetical protein
MAIYVKDYCLIVLFMLRIIARPGGIHAGPAETAVLWELFFRQEE